MTKTDELLPCPFCGCNVKEQDVEQSPLVDFYCMNCDARFGWVTKEHSVAKKLFNTRTAEAPLLAEIERLNKLCAEQEDALHQLHAGYENQILELKSKLEQMVELLDQINRWTKAYPIEVFPEPDLKKAREVLENAGITLDSISAYAMRHVVNGVSEIIKKSDLDKITESK